MRTTITLLFIASLACAQAGLKLAGTIWTGKFEFTQDQGGRQTYDFQNYGQVYSVDLLVRGFWAEQSVHQMEFGVGKTAQLSKNADGKPRVSLTQYAGLTTDGAVFTPLLASFNFFGRGFYLLADPKFYFHDRHDPLHQNTLYQEASFPLDKNGKWQADWRRLQVNGQLTAFNRFCLERRLLITSHSHLAVLPFVDTANKSVGVYGDFIWH
jgi:hypothetical protein